MYAGYIKIYTDRGEVADLTFSYMKNLIRQEVNVICNKYLPKNVSISISENKLSKFARELMKGIVAHKTSLFRELTVRHLIRDIILFDGLSSVLVLGLIIRSSEYEKIIIQHLEGQIEQLRIAIKHEMQNDKAL